MRQLKKILFLITFFFGPYIASAQLSLGYQLGLGTAFLTSNQIISSPGFGLYLGMRSSYFVGKRVEIFGDYIFDFASMNVVGYTYSAAPPTDLIDTLIPATTTDNILKYSFLVSVGVNFYIIPDHLSIGLAPMAGYYLMEASDPSAAIGPIPQYQREYITPLLSAGELATGNFDYGAHVRLTYKFSPKWEIGLDYYKGFNNLTPQIPGGNTTMNDYVLSVHFIPAQYCISKPMQNKLTR